MSFVIVIHSGGQLSSEFYAGKTYIYQGGLFPVYASKDEAKRYTSRKRAENAAAKLNKKIDGRCEVKELEGE